MAVVLAAGFPNPVGWVIDRASGFLGGVAHTGFEAVLGGLTAWVLDAVVWVVGGVFGFFLAATDPNVQADWFASRHGPYGETLAIGAVLLVGFVLAGVAQGVLTGDTAGMLRRFTLELPVAVVGMVGLVTVTQALIELTDALSRGVLGHFSDQVHTFTGVVGSLGSLSGGTATAFVVFLLALLAVLAGVVLVAELVVRSALIYVVVALAPLVLAAQLWPALRGMARKLLELLVALVVSKLVVAVALAVAAAAVAGAGSGGAVVALPPPEVVAHDPAGSVTQAVGILLAAVAAFGVSAFTPLLLVKLLPLTEAALVAHGVRGGPLRAGQQGLSLASSARLTSAARYGRLAAGPVPGGTGASASTSGTAGAAAAPPVAAAATAAGTAQLAARRGPASAARTLTETPPRRSSEERQASTEEQRRG